MLAIERRNEILMKLQAERRVVVSELSRCIGRDYTPGSGETCQ